MNDHTEEIKSFNALPWIGVDLDGTLAYYDGWKGIEHIGPPIPRMLERVKAWLAEGLRVKIFTARIGGIHKLEDMERARAAIQDWCLKHVGVVLEITCTKDLAMIELWDDRAKQVVPNTGYALESLATGTVDQMLAIIREEELKGQGQ